MPSPNANHCGGVKPNDITVSLRQQVLRLYNPCCHPISLKVRSCYLAVPVDLTLESIRVYVSNQYIRLLVR